MISISKALKIIKNKTGPVGTERIDLNDAVGRVLAEDIVADTDLPPFDRSQMDGFAVVARDTAKGPVDLKIVGESAAGGGWHHTLKTGEAIRIMTGAPVPKGADAVQRLEVTAENDGLVTINESTKTGQFIVAKGNEVKKGKVVIGKGSVLTSRNIAIPAAFGYPLIRVSKQARVTIISTGSEIVAIDQKPEKDQIRNSNSLMLKVLTEQCGAAAAVSPIVGDSIGDLKQRIATAARRSDLVILTGGVSVGKYDFTKTALVELGAEIFFDKIALKPGKPTVFAKLGKTFIFGLPGNPVSAAVTFHLFVRELMMLMQSASKTGLRESFAVVDERAKGTKDRDTYLPARLETDKNGRLIAVPLKWHGSSDFIGFARAEALVIVPKGETREKGEIAEIVHL
ncbi:MAG: gephyrin-like molybdotransferase Glp [Pyrinomonadaceae bacterium]